MLRRELIALFSVAPMVMAQAQKRDVGLQINHEPVWVSDSKWRKKPNGVSGEFRMATVLLFDKKGEFRMGECLLTRLDDVVSISEGDGFVRHVGSWRADGDRVVITYSLRTPTRLVAKPLVTGPVETAFVTSTRDPEQIEISNAGKRFRPNRTVDPQQLAKLLGTFR